MILLMQMSRDSIPTESDFAIPFLNHELLSLFDASINFINKLVLLLLFILSLSSAASAMEYYVSPYGNDAGSGTISDPWAHISYAVEKARAGDHIYLCAGVYSPEYVTFKNSGTPENPISFSSYNGRAIIDGNRSLPFEPKIVFYVKGDYINISNITLQNLNCTSAITINSDYVCLDNIQITGIGYSSSPSSGYGKAIEVVGSHAIISNVTTSDTGWNQIQIYMTSNKSTTNISIVNCDLSKSLSHNLLDLFNNRYNESVYLKDIKIINNKFHDQSTYGMIFPHGAAPFHMDNIIIEDNLFMNGYTGLDSQYFRDSIIKNNTFINFSNYGLGAGTSVKVQDNVTYVGNIAINSSSTFSVAANSTIYMHSNSFEDLTFRNGNAVVYGYKSNQEQVDLKYGANVTFRYLNNSIFRIKTAGNPTFVVIDETEYSSICSQSRIYVSDDKTSAFIVDVYPMQAFPSSGKASVTVSIFNTTLPLGSVLVEFTATSTNGNNVDFTISELQPYATYVVKKDGINFKEVIADQEGTVRFSNSVWSQHTFTLIQTASGSTPEEPEVPESSGGSGTSFTPSATSFTSSVGSSTTFSADSEEQFTSAKWYFNGAEVASGTSYTQNWAASGTFTVRFDGVTDLGTLSRTWDVVVSGSEYSDISIIPSASIVKPGETFSLDVYIDPKQPVTGAQFNLHYGSLASVTSVKDGGLFKTGGLTNTFQSGLIDNSAGVLKNVYSAIVGSGTVSTPGSMAKVNMVAGSSSGMLELTMSNVVLSDAYSNPAPYDISYASVLVDTAPVFNAIPAKSVEEESTLTFTVSATDADGDILTYSCTSLPQGATFDASAKTFRWTPSRGQAGTYSVVFDVTDGYLNDSATAIITVSTLDLAPVIALFEPASGSVFEEGQTIDMRVVAEDPEGKALSYIMTIDGVQVSSSAFYQWVTDYSSAGTYSIGVTVSDGNTQASRTHIITITDVHPRWDVNQDGVVNILDITLVGQNYGKTYTGTLPRWDVNQDGIVNVQDMSIVAAHFGETVQ